MAFVYELVSSDANVAVDEAGPDGQVVLVPKVDGRFARIGVVALVEGEPVMLPGGHRGVTLRRCTVPSWVAPTRRAEHSASTSSSGPTRPRSPSRSASRCAPTAPSSSRSSRPATAAA